MSADASATNGNGAVPTAVKVTDFTFKYQNAGYPDVEALTEVSFELKQGARCLLIGANGVGKSTLLRVLAGKHLHEPQDVLVLGGPAFYQTTGVSGVSYLGTGGWTRSIAFAGSNVPFQADIPVREMMLHLQTEHASRRDELYDLLEIDPDWRMHTVSDGQRRRVQIMLALLRPFKLLLLDEVTVDLDVVGRADFLAYLRRETETRGVSVVYATHIFDGMDGWPTDVLLMDSGTVVRAASYAALAAEPGFGSLYRFVEHFLRAQRDRRREEAERRKAQAASLPPATEKVQDAPLVRFADRVNSGFTPGRMAAYMGSS